MHTIPSRPGARAGSSSVSHPGHPAQPQKRDEGETAGRSVLCLYIVQSPINIIPSALPLSGLLPCPALMLRLRLRCYMPLCALWLSLWITLRNPLNCHACCRALLLSLLLWASPILHCRCPFFVSQEESVPADGQYWQIAKPSRTGGLAKSICLNTLHLLILPSVMPGPSKHCSYRPSAHFVPQPFTMYGPAWRNIYRRHVRWRRRRVAVRWQDCRGVGGLLPCFCDQALAATRLRFGSQRRQVGRLVLWE